MMIDLIVILIYNQSFHLHPPLYTVNICVAPDLK